MDFPKKQAQRLMPLYLLEYSEKLFTNHPNPEDPWGGGSDYTAGQGITITNNEISVDTNVIATKSDIPDFTNYYYVNNEIQNGEFITKINGNGLEYSKQWTPNSISITADCREMGFDNKPGIVIKTDTNKKVVVSDSIAVYNNEHNSVTGIDGDNVTVSSGDGKYTRLENGKLTLDDGQVREFNLPTTKQMGTYTLATTDDYPIYDPHDQLFISLTGQENTFYEKVNLSDAPGRMFYVNLSALNPVFKDGLTSTYNEQTNQLEVSLNAVIPDTTNFVTLDNAQTITGTKTFQNGALKVENTLNCRTMTYDGFGFFDLDVNNQGTIERIIFELPTYKPKGTKDAPTQYSLATIDDIPTTATSTSTSTVTPTTGTFVTGTSTNTANVVNSVTYTPSSETLTFTYDDNTTASFTFLTSSTTVTSGTTSVVTSVTDSTSNAMTGATVSTSTTTTLS